jgi:hypothetical protein
MYLLECSKSLKFAYNFRTKYKILHADPFSGVVRVLVTAETGRWAFGTARDESQGIYSTMSHLDQEKGGYAGSSCNAT